MAAASAAAATASGVTINGSLRIAGFGTTAGSSLGSTGAGTFSVDSGATASAASIHLSALNVTGTVVVLPNGTNTGVTVVNTLNLDPTVGKLDLNDNDIIYSQGLSAGIRFLLSSAYNNGAWTGSKGLTSTAAKNAALTSVKTAIGYGSAFDLGYTTFDGQTVSPGSQLIKYTYYGDSNLDGKVDLGNDFNLFLQGVLTPHSNIWELGDYNYDGGVDFIDFRLFIDGYATQGQPLGGLESVIASSPLLTAAQRSEMLSIVPEPSMVLCEFSAPLIGVSLLRRETPWIIVARATSPVFSVHLADHGLVARATRAFLFLHVIFPPCSALS